MDPSFDSSTFMGLSDEWWEQLFVPNWTLDRNTWSFQFGNFVPQEYMVGGLAEKWSWTDPTTLAITLHEGIKWQNKPPVNGREFTADDVVFTFDRLMGTGHGYTAPNEAYTGFVGALDKVTLTGKYTFDIKFKQASTWSNMRTIYESIIQPYEAPEVVALGAHVNDGNMAIGTGPYQFSEITRGSVMTLVASSNYWNTDERYPNNKLPYIQKLQEIVIKDDSTATAAFQTGKLDFMGSQGLLNKQVMEKNNKDAVIMATPSSSTAAGMRIDLKPFSDIRVRKALQMAINIDTIAKGYYSGAVVAEPLGNINPGEKGYAYAYADWPQSLKDEYSYNPTKAKALLTEAGYPNGFDTNLVFSPETADSAFFQIFKSMWADIGVNVELKSMDRVTGDNFLASGKHDGLFGGGGGGTMPPQINVRTLTKGAVGNYEFLDDPVIQDCYEKITGAATPEIAKQVVQTFDKHMIEQHYYITGPAATYYCFWQPYMKGFSGEVSPGRNGALALCPYFYAARVWIDQDLKTSMGR